MEGHLNLCFQQRGPNTVLTQSRSTLPLQASKPMEIEGSGDAAWVMLLNPTGGLLGGDCLTTTIDLAKDSHAVLTTPSATKVYRADFAPTAHRTVIHLAEDAVLEYLPDHVIPHPGASLIQSLSIDMEPGSRAIVLDAFSVGLVARGERWLFKELTTEVLISRSGQPVCRDRICIQPDSWIPSGLGGMEGASYSATMLLCADGTLDWHDIAGTFTTCFSDTQGATGAASALANGGCLIRYYTHSAQCLKEITRTLWAMARCALLDGPPLVLR
jgi:urease accessory protein